MKKLNKKGFTLIELIVVIAIIAALMLILVPTMNGFVNTAKKQANTANAKAVYTAIVASETAQAAGIYAASARTKTICNTTTVFPEFWSGSAVTECTVTGTTTNGKFTVTVGGTDTDTNGVYSGS